jgi:hypothetical protein
MFRLFKILIVLLVLFFFLGCKKDSNCEGSVQGDWELVK